MKRKWKEDFISIVIPVYNAAAFLERTLNCVKNQSFSNWELILVEDGSKDNSLDVIQKWLKEQEFTLDTKNEEDDFAGISYGMKKVLLLINERNHGVAYARNRGIQQASGQYLVYLDADDYWESNKLEKQYHFMKQNGYAFSFTSYEFASTEGIKNGKIVHVPKQICYEKALTNTIISTITVMFDRKQISKEFLLMPEDCQREDTATWWKILKNGYIAYGLDEVLSVYCRHRGSHSSNKIKAVIGTYKMYRKQEQLGFFKTVVCMVKYIIGAVRRRL